VTAAGGSASRGATPPLAAAAKRRNADRGAKGAEMSILGLWRTIGRRSQLPAAPSGAVPVRPIELAAVPWRLAAGGAAPAATGLGARLVAAIDSFIAFLALERALIARNNQLLSAGNAWGPYRSILRWLLVINAHIWVFWAIGRKTQGFASFVVFYTAGFTTWNMFRSISHDTQPLTLTANYTKNINIKWVHLFLAELAWDFAMTMVPFTLTMGFYTIFPVPTLGPPIQCPNFLLFFYVLLVAGTLGAGYGIIMDTVSLRWPIVASVREPLNWILYITSGIYISFTIWPWYVRQYLWYNPILTLIEYCRLALYTGYDVADLSLLYASLVSLAFLFVGLCYRKRAQRALSQR
jgi:ABC-type polysaccharide/polyol phosphate export permease